MRKRDSIKSTTPIIIAAMWTYILSGVELFQAEEHRVVMVGLWVILVIGSVILSDKGFDFFDKNDNEEDE